MANKSKPIAPEYVGVETAEAMTDRSRWSWRRDCYEGRCASVKVGRRLLIPISEIRRIMAEGYRPRLVADDDGRARDDAKRAAVSG